MARPKSENPKVKVTVTLDPEVAEALGPLQAELEAQAYGVVGQGDVHALHGPVRHTRSSTVQAAILALCSRLGVGVAWKRPMAMDLQTGDPVEVPDGEDIHDSPEAAAEAAKEQ